MKELRVNVKNETMFNEWLNWFIANDITASFIIHGELVEKIKSRINPNVRSAFYKEQYIEKTIVTVACDKFTFIVEKKHPPQFYTD